jgi:hypothetical protein
MIPDYLGHQGFFYHQCFEDGKPQLDVKKTAGNR